ncbi:MAG: hypothetical protein AB4372_34520 [Xenococcus sp. (in: cyanobacteria)]
MKTRNDNHLQMATQESNIDRSGDKKGLFKTFNSKGLKKSCSLFLSSIVTLSILSVANSSFAFPAQVRKDGNLSLFYAPVRTSQKKKADTITTYQNLRRRNQNLRRRNQDLRMYTQLIPFTTVDVLYCRNDGWCYISGYYSQGRNNQPIGYYPEKAWARSIELCEPADGFNTTPLSECGSNTNKYDGIVASNKKDYKYFFCTSPGKSANPWRWLFAYVRGVDFCKKN